MGTSPKELIQSALAFEETEIVPYDLRVDDAVWPDLLAYLGKTAQELPVLSHLPFHATEPRQRAMPCRALSSEAS